MRSCFPPCTAPAWRRERAWVGRPGPSLGLCAAAPCCACWKPLFPPTRLPCSGPNGGPVVGVVGASHLPGMQGLWDSGGWREAMAGGLLEAPTAPRTPENPEQTGVRCEATAACLCC